MHKLYFGRNYFNISVLRKMRDGFMMISGVSRKCACNITFGKIVTTFL